MKHPVSRISRCRYILRIFNKVHSHNCVLVSLMKANAISIPRGFESIYMRYLEDFYMYIHTLSLSYIY